ncbi:MAG: glycosyltransferase [Anaerolineaceae bacterium]|nr:glycosyltransferase [Anaerolineaceae bacterium]
MRILLVADGRSPITRHWLQSLFALQHEVILVSTYPCDPPPGVQAMQVFPVAFSALGGSQFGRQSGAEGRSAGWKPLVARFRNLLLAGRYTLGPPTLAYYGPRFQRLVETAQPDLVHALRIPFEGMLAAYTPPGVPLLVSIWGNDLTLHARGSRAMGALTRRTLQRAGGLIADARRDVRLAWQWGLPVERPTLVVPGSGGVDLVEVHRLRSMAHNPWDGVIPGGAPWVVNPRGFRPGSIRSDVFFEAIPLVLQRRPEVQFVCTGMAGQPEALRWVERLKIGNNVRLLPYLTQAYLWDLFTRAQLSVSVSVHDGTPNSLLEAMACGCFPIAGDIESLREWIVPGVNGMLVDPTRPATLAEAILTALDNGDLRSTAAELNLQLIQQRADVNLVRSQIEVFYQRFYTAPPVEEGA